MDVGALCWDDWETISARKKTVFTIVVLFYISPIFIWVFSLHFFHFWEHEHTIPKLPINETAQKQVTHVRFTLFYFLSCTHLQYCRVLDIVYSFFHVPLHTHTHTHTTFSDYAITQTQCKKRVKVVHTHTHTHTHTMHACQVWWHNPLRSPIDSVVSQWRETVGSLVNKTCSDPASLLFIIILCKIIIIYMVILQMCD